MALTQQEKEIVEYGKSQGKSREEILSALDKFRSQSAPKKSGGIKEIVTDPIKTLLVKPADRFAEAVGRSGALGSNIKRGYEEMADKGESRSFGGIEVEAQRAVEDGGGSQIAGDMLKSASYLYGGQGAANAVSNFAKGNVVRGSIGGAITGAIGGGAYESGRELQEGGSLADTLMAGAEGAGYGAATGAVFGGAIPALGGAIRKSTPLLNSLKARMANKANGLPSGVVQKGRELAERIPRAIERGREATQEAALRAERIAQSTPKVANAIKQGLAEPFIEVVQSVDEPTKKAFKKVIETAEQVAEGRTKTNPTIVGGELAAKQYDLIDKERKSIGKAIGDFTKGLSKDAQVAMEGAYNRLNERLQDAGITLKRTDKGEIDWTASFKGTNFTPGERTRIRELYELATEAGETLSPAQILKKDQLFSKLRRQSNYDGIGDILIDGPDEQPESLFSVFRDVFSDTLDEVSEGIRPLNQRYRQLRTLQDQLDESIFKTPGFLKDSNPAEFAKVNMRRIFGEAQSSPAFEAIADKMDEVARSLGYTDARPKDVAEFAQSIRKLYPEIIPQTGFTGSLRLGIGDVISGLLEAGKADVRDQRRALKELLEEVVDIGDNIIDDIGESFSKGEIPETIKEVVSDGFPRTKSGKIIRGGYIRNPLVPKQPVKGQSVQKTSSLDESLTQEAKSQKVYHGTNTDFDSFDPAKSTRGTFGKAAYVTTDPSITKYYGNIQKEFEIPSNLKLYKSDTRVIKESDFELIKSLYKKETGKELVINRSGYSEGAMESDIFWKGTTSEIQDAKELFKQHLIKKGFDGVQEADTIAVFDSTKLKKAQGNEPKIPAETRINIVDIIDDFRLNGGKNLELQEDAARIAEDLGIPMPKRYGDLVNKLEQIIQKIDEGREVIAKPLLTREALSQEAKKHSTVDSFVKSVLNKQTFTTPKEIKVYRGEGGGIGNTTFVKGKYFADSKKFASTFGDVIEDVIPAGTKIFDFDLIKNNPNQTIIDDELLREPEKLTSYLLDNGITVTKNTNSRGVEYVFLKKQPLDELAEVAKRFNDKGDFLDYMASSEGYNKHKEPMKRLRELEGLGASDLIWNKSRNVGVYGDKLKKINSQLEDIWKNVNKSKNSR